MRVLVAPNAFKGALGAVEATRAIAAGLKDGDRRVAVDLMPISDGGDGLIDTLCFYWKCRRFARTVVGPLGKRKTARFAFVPAKRLAIIEMAQASGMAGIPKSRLNPLKATSYGTGQLIGGALRLGAREIVVGLGGSATSDGGCGMAAALGVRLLDARGKQLPLGAEPLLRLSRIELGELPRRLKGVRVKAVSDVTNPLTGPRGSAAVYGPQKGATPAMVKTIDRALRNFARVAKRDLGKDVAAIQGAGAAGGLGAGLLCFLGAKLVPGAEWVLAALDADRRLRRADLAISGEGRFDSQSFFGKAPMALAVLAAKRQVQFVCLCGQVTEKAEAALAARGIVARSLMKPGETVERSMRATAGRLRAAAAAAIAGLLLAVALPPRACAADYSVQAMDELYFHRDRPGTLQKAIDGLEGRMKEAPKDAESCWRLGRAYVRQGEGERSKGKKVELFQRAESLLNSCVELDAKIAEEHYWLAVAMGLRGQQMLKIRAYFLIDPIKRELSKTLELDPNHAGAHRVRGELLLQLPGFKGGDAKAGIQELETAVALAPRHTSHCVALGEAYLDHGRKAAAAAALEKCLAVKDPDDPGEYDDDIREAKRLLDFSR